MNNRITIERAPGGLYIVTVAGRGLWSSRDREEAFTIAAAFFEALQRRRT